MCSPPQSLKSASDKEDSHTTEISSLCEHELVLLSQPSLLLLFAACSHYTDECDFVLPDWCSASPLMNNPLVPYRQKKKKVYRGRLIHERHGRSLLHTDTVLMYIRRNLGRRIVGRKQRTQMFLIWGEIYRTCDRWIVKLTNCENDTFVCQCEFDFSHQPQC